MPGYGAVCWGSLDEAQRNPGFNWEGLAEIKWLVSRASGRADCVPLVGLFADVDYPIARPCA